MILLEDLQIQIVVSTDQLPKGSRESMYFHILIQKDGVFIRSIDHEKTIQKQENAKRLRKQLIKQQRRTET